VSRGKPRAAKIRPSPATVREAKIVERRIAGDKSILRLNDGGSLETRRFFCAGAGDTLRIAEDRVDVLPPPILARFPATTRIEIGVREPLQSMHREGASSMEQVKKLLHQRRIHLPGLIGMTALIELDPVKQAALRLGQLDIRLTHTSNLA
jgi:hypothetical protein